MGSSYPAVERSSSMRPSEPAQTEKSLGKGGYLLIALGIITLIGSLVAAGCLYAHLGYLVFAIGGGGTVISIVCFVLSNYCRKQNQEPPQSENPNEEAPDATHFPYLSESKLEEKVLIWQT